MHVSILSICSFSGRLLSGKARLNIAVSMTMPTRLTMTTGIGSDFLVQLRLSRLWCLFLSAVVFTVSQLAGAAIAGPHALALVSTATGLAYGFLFGVFPSLVAHAFGIGGLTQNWGVMTLAPVVSGNVFNLVYGAVYDAHSTLAPGGSERRDCRDGLRCYRAAFYVTFCSGLAGVAVCLWSVWTERRIHGPARARKAGHERLA
ncbi:hypothetical protein VTN02DRAFT_2415 [Thermoascus thermophilus]